MLIDNSEGAELMGAKIIKGELLRISLKDKDGNITEIPSSSLSLCPDGYSGRIEADLDDCSASRLRRFMITEAVPVDIECHECKGDGCAPCDGTGRVDADFEQCAARDDLEHCEHWHGEPGDGHLTSQHQAFTDVCCHCGGGEPFSCSGCGWANECWCDEDKGGEVPW